jgi:aminopeptidase N
MAEELIGGFEKMPMSERKFNALNSLNTYLGALKDIEKIKRGVDAIVKFRDAVPEQFKNQTDPFINGMILQGLITKKEGVLKTSPDDAKLKELVEYIKSKLPEKDKKGF